MENKVNEYLEQLNKEIARYEKRLQERKDVYIKNIKTSEFHTIENFGIAKYAEEITKITGQLKILYQQRQIFMSIFEIEE